MKRILISNKPTARHIRYFGDLLNHLEGPEVLEIVTENDQLRDWSPFRIEAKIYEMTGISVRVERV